MTFTVAGAANSGNNGTFTILSVPSKTTLQTVAGTVSESFNPANVTVVTGIPSGAVFELSNIHHKFNAYVSLFAAVAIVDRRGMDIEASALRTRLGAEGQRVETIAPNRRFEPLQQPLIRRRDWRDVGG